MSQLFFLFLCIFLVSCSTVKGKKSLLKSNERQVTSFETDSKNKRTLISIDGYINYSEEFGTAEKTYKNSQKPMNFIFISGNSADEIWATAINNQMTVKNFDKEDGGGQGLIYKNWKCFRGVNLKFMVAMFQTINRLSPSFSGITHCTSKLYFD